MERAGGWRGVIAGLVLLSLLLFSLRCVERTRLWHGSGSQPIRAALLYVSEGLSPVATSVGLVLQLLGPSSRRTRTLRRVTAVLPTALALARGFIEEPTVEVRDSTSLLGSLTSAALVAFNEEAPTTAAIQSAVLFIASASITFIRFVRQALLLHAAHQHQLLLAWATQPGSISLPNGSIPANAAADAAAAGGTPAPLPTFTSHPGDLQHLAGALVVRILALALVHGLAVVLAPLLAQRPEAGSGPGGAHSTFSGALQSSAHGTVAGGPEAGPVADTGSTASLVPRREERSHHDAQAISTNPDGNMATPFLTAVPLSSRAQAVAAAGHPAEPHGPSDTPPPARPRDPRSRQRPPFSLHLPGLVSAVTRIPSGAGNPHHGLSHVHHLPPLVGPTGPVSDWHVAFVRLLDAVLMLLHYLAAPGCPGVHPAGPVGPRTAALHLGYGSSSSSEAGAQGAAQGAVLPGSVCAGSGVAASGACEGLMAAGGEDGLRSSLLCLAALLVATWGASVQLLDAIWALWPGRHRAGLPLYCLANTTATWCSAAARVAVLLLLGARAHGKAGPRAGGCAAGDAGGGAAVAMAAVMLMNLSANGDQAGSYALQCAAALACTAFMHWRLEPQLPGTALAVLYGGLYGCALCLMWVMARARRLAQQRALQQVLQHHRRALQARQQLQAEQKRNHQVLGWAATAARAPPSPLHNLSLIPSLRDSRLPFYRSDPAVRRQPSAPLALHNPARSHSTFPNAPSPLGPTPPSHSPIPSPVLAPNPSGMLPSSAQPYATDARPDPTAPPPSYVLAQALMTTSSSVAASQGMSPGNSGHVATTDALTTVQTSSRRSTADVAASQRSSFDVGLPPRLVDTPAAGAVEASAAAPLRYPGDPHRTSGDGKGQRQRAEADTSGAALLPPRQRSAPQHHKKVPPANPYPPQPTWPPGVAVPSPAPRADSTGLYGQGPSPFATAPVVLIPQGQLHTAAMRRSSANASGPAAMSSLLASSPAVHGSASLPVQALPHGARPASGHDVHGVYGPGGGVGQAPRRTVSDQDRRHTHGHVRMRRSHPARHPGVGPDPLDGNVGQLLPVESSAASSPLPDIEAATQGAGHQRAEQAPEAVTSHQQLQDVKGLPIESSSAAGGPHAAPDGTMDKRAVMPVVGMAASSKPPVQGPGVTGVAGSAPNASGAETAQSPANVASASSGRAPHRISQVQPNINVSLLQEHSSSAATGGRDQCAGASSQSLAVGATAAEQPGTLRAATTPPLGLAPSASAGGGSSIPLPAAGAGTGSNAVFSSTLLDADMYDRLLSSASSPFLLGPTCNRNNSALNTQPLNQSPNVTQQLRTNAYRRQSSGLSDGYPHSRSLPIPALPGPGPGTGAGVGVTLGGESSTASRSSANATAAAVAAVQKGRPVLGDQYRRQGSTGQGMAGQGLTVHGGSFRRGAQDDGPYAPGPSSEPGRRARVKSRAPRQVITLPDGRQVYQSETLAAAASSSTTTGGAMATGGGTLGSASALSSMHNDRVADMHMLSGGTLAHVSPAAAVAQAEQAASYFSRSSYGVGSQANGGLSSQEQGTPRSPVGWALDSERQGRYNSGSIMTSNAYYNYQPLTNPNSTAATNAHMSTTMTDSWRFLMSSHHSQPASGTVPPAASSSSAPPPPAGPAGGGIAAAGAAAPYFGQGMPATNAAAAYGSSGGGTMAPGPTATVETLSAHMTLTSRTTASSSRFGSISTAGQITGATPTTTGATLFNTADSGAAMRGTAAAASGTAGVSSANPSAGRTSSVIYNLRGSLELARHLHDTGLIRIGEEDGGGSGEDATGSSSWRLQTSGGVGGGDGSGLRGSGTHTGETARNAAGEQAGGGLGIVDRVLNRFFNRCGVGGAVAGAAGGGGGARKLRPEVRGPPWRTAAAGKTDPAGLRNAGAQHAQHQQQRSPRGPQWDGANLMDEQQQRLQQYMDMRDRSGEGAGAAVQAFAPEDTHPTVQQLLVQGGKLVATPVHGDGVEAAGGPAGDAHPLSAVADMLGELYSHDAFAVSPQGVPGTPTAAPSAFAAAAAQNAGSGRHGPPAAAAVPLPPHDSGSGRRSVFASGPGRTMLGSIPSGDFPDSDSGGTAVTAAPSSPFVQHSSPVSPALPPQPDAATHLPATDGSSGLGQVTGPESAPLSDFTLHALLNSHNGVTSSEALAQVSHGPGSAGAGYVPSNSSANVRTVGSAGGSHLSSSDLVSFADVTLGSVIPAGERGGGAHPATAGRTGSGSAGSNAQAPRSGAARKASGSRRAVRAQTLGLMASHGSIARGPQLPPASGSSRDGVAGAPEAGAGVWTSPGPASATTGRGVQLMPGAAVAVAVAVGSTASRRGLQREGPAGGHPEVGPLRSAEGSSTASVTFPTLMGPAVAHAGVAGAGGYPAAVSASSFGAVKDASLPLLSVSLAADDAVPHAQAQPLLLKPHAQLAVGDDGGRPVLNHSSSAGGQMGGGGAGGSSPWSGLLRRGKAPSDGGVSDHAARARGHAGGAVAGQQKTLVSRTSSSGEQPQPPSHSNSPPLARVEDTARLSRALKGLRKRIKTGVGKLAGRS